MPAAGYEIGDSGHCERCGTSLVAIIELNEGIETPMEIVAVKRDWGVPPKGRDVVHLAPHRCRLLHLDEDEDVEEVTEQSRPEMHEGLVYRD